MDGSRLAPVVPLQHLHRMRLSLRPIAALLALALATPVVAQDAPPEGGPKVGDFAPDFTLPASTKDGVSPLPLKLSELRGQVVVIAFFPKSRTKG